jgi:ABC-type nitrate/sulfonate/bicarbonate transport system permease component
LRTDVVIVGMITIGVVGLIIDRSIRFLGKRAMPWSRTFSA